MIRNDAGGHLNRALFWGQMAPGGGAPAGDLAAAIDRDWGGLEALQTAVNDAGAKRFGPGRAWAVVLDVDVWEHAY